MIVVNKQDNTEKRNLPDTERNNFMGAREILEYGLIDKIITKEETAG